MTEFGFVAEPHKRGVFLVSPATRKDSVVTVHDLSGFLGRWAMKDGGVFFPSISGESFCSSALASANEYANSRNKESTNV